MTRLHHVYQKESGLGMSDSIFFYVISGLRGKIKEEREGGRKKEPLAMECEGIHGLYDDMIMIQTSLGKAGLNWRSSIGEDK